ncbi:hypothetical protein CEXT_440061, partial [Caerostris extrusa]
MWTMVQEGRQPLMEVGCFKHTSPLHLGFLPPLNCILKQG